ncbi:hypothetical protein FIBSPDRAFT_941013 [Athelia psychrophila]|uniref:Uncharacterized protein n=1 Tax=Athelia psychrophila TaxID=1759441 RepID=A0A167UXP5_9AGAM|nr:hypothetical protein FIBSPDRAFT_941013 [Fibularhizoctonia sp. CBS 109695]
MFPLDPVSKQFPLSIDSALQEPLSEEVSVTTYSSVAILAAFIWTWLLDVSEEVEIVKRKRFSVPIAAYYCSRLTSLGGCICNMLLGLGIERESALNDAVSLAFFWIAQASISLLFYFRICAVYKHSKTIRYAFFALWVLVTLSPATILLGPSSRCKAVNLRAHQPCLLFSILAEGYRPHIHCYIWGPLTLLSEGLILINDTLVFIGVSLEMYKNVAPSGVHISHMSRFKLLIRGNDLYKLSKMLLKSGQLYYGQSLIGIPDSNSVTIGVQLCTTIAVFLGVHYSQLLYMSYIPLSSALACKVFRMVLLCDTTVDPLNTLEIHELFQWEPNNDQWVQGVVRTIV